MARMAGQCVDAHESGGGCIGVLVGRIGVRFRLVTGRMVGFFGALGAVDGPDGREGKTRCGHPMDAAGMDVRSVV